jgi:hypothetical protein
MVCLSSNMHTILKAKQQGRVTKYSTNECKTAVMDIVGFSMSITK